MESQVSEVLENILGLLGLEGSFEVVEGPDEVTAAIETDDAGRLIGYRGETIDALQLLVNQIVNRQTEEYKRVVVDVGGWRKNKEGDLENNARRWAEEVLESGQELELDPMPSWQRRIIHMIIGEVEGVESESVGEGRDRHLVIRPGSGKSTKESADIEDSEAAQAPTEAKVDSVAEEKKTVKPAKKVKKVKAKTPSKKKLAS